MTPKECINVLELLVMTYLFKVGTSIERKIEQSLIAARADGCLQTSELIKVAQLLSFGVEGEPSFWNFFEECL